MDFQLWVKLAPDGLATLAQTAALDYILKEFKAVSIPAEGDQTPTAPSAGAVEFICDNDVQDV